MHTVTSQFEAQTVIKEVKSTLAHIIYKIISPNLSDIWFKKTHNFNNTEFYAWPFVYTSIVVQFSCSVMSNSLWPHEPQHTRPPCPSPTPGVHSDSHPSSQWWPSSRLILCRPLLLLPSICPSIRVFSNKSALCIRWPKYWSFSFSISPSNEHPGLISFRTDWLKI